MGNEIFVYLKLGEPGRVRMDEEAAADQVLMSVDPDVPVEEDQEMDVVFDRSRLHLFETASGEAISHGF